MDTQSKKEKAAEPIKKRFQKLAALSAGHFMNDFYVGLIPPISFVFAESLGLSMTQQGMLAFVITSFGSFAQPFVGSFVDRHGKPYLLILSVIWVAFWMSIAGLVQNYYLLLAVVALGALASALFHPLGTSTVVKLGRKSKGKILSIFMTIGGLSAAVAPAVALPLVHSYGLKSLVFLVIPGIAIAGFLYWSGIQEVKLKAEAPRKTEKVKGSLVASIRKLLVLCLISVNKNFIRRGLTAFGIQILIMKGLELKMAVVLLSLNLFMVPVGTMLGGFMNDRYGSRTSLMIFNGFVGGLMLAIIFSDGLLAAGAFILIGGVLSASNTPIVIISHDLMPNQTSTSYGWVMGFAGGIGAMGLLLIGRISDAYGLTAATQIMLVPAFLLVALSYRLLRTKEQ
ncbi:MAG: MFS transporter [Peptostreptococcaceae bacterium]|nr:MFS transporter [Peptostreptococcaceae bacterium]